MVPITVGAVAPDFNVLDSSNKYISLSSLRGKRVLMSWHPLAWTPVCTDQMRALENNYERFQSLNTVPLGFSVDAQPCKEVWTLAIQVKHISLPADFWPHGKIASDYGIFNETDGVSERANIIIDEKGIVKWVKVYPPAQLPDIDEVLDVLSQG